YGSGKKTGFSVKNISGCCSEGSCDPAGGGTLDLLKFGDHGLLTIPPNFRAIVCDWDDTGLVELAHGIGREPLLCVGELADGSKSSGSSGYFDFDMVGEGKATV